MTEKLANLRAKSNTCFVLFQDQYDRVSTHTLKGIDFLDKYSHFLKERCSIETRYASDLK